MKTVCLYFEIHQNIHLKRYRFFDIGTDHYYYDDYENERAIAETAERSYVPALKALIEMAETYGDYLKMGFSLSGTAIELLEIYAPQVIDLLQELSRKCKVEFLAETYSHGLASLSECSMSFKDEVERLCKKVEELFGQRPQVFRNSALTYSDDIGLAVSQMGFKGMLTEGAKHVLGWKSPHYVYHCAYNPNLKLLLRDSRLSEDISLRFNDSSWSEYPLFADTYADWVANNDEGPVVNLFMELCALGIFQPLSSNILEFFKALPEQLRQRGVVFATPSEICAKAQSAGALHVPHPITWVDEERDISSWLGNVMQREAFEKLYSVGDRVMLCSDRRIKQDWDYLQASNNLRFINTKASSYGGYRGIYDSPYDAFTNYMNILGDFTTRVNNLFPADVDSDEINSYLTTIKNQEEELALRDKEISKLQDLIEQLTKENKEAAKATAKREKATKPKRKTTPRTKQSEENPKPEA